jgi:hypothetical protein
MTDSIYLLAVLCAVVAVAEWLGRLPTGRWLGGAIISLLLGILLSNVGLIPTASSAPPLYEYLIAVGAPVAIFLLLPDVCLQALKRAGLPMLVAFGIGSVGTLVGVATAIWLTNADEWLGRLAGGRSRDTTAIPRLPIGRQLPVWQRPRHRLAERAHTPVPADDHGRWPGGQHHRHSNPSTLPLNDARADPACQASARRAGEHGRSLTIGGPNTANDITPAINPEWSTA